MSVTLDLPHELEDELAAKAAQLGLPLPEYILRVLSTTVAIGDKPKTGADLVEYWQNEEVIGARPDVTDSQGHAQQSRRRAERRTRT
jgi:hypothetical protein